MGAIVSDYKQIDIANWVQLSPAFVCLLFKGQRNMSWPTAKKLARKIGTRPEKIMDKRGEELQRLLYREFANRERKRLRKRRKK